MSLQFTHIEQPDCSNDEERKESIEEVKLFDTNFFIPEAYTYHYSQINCYPNIIPGLRCYGGASEQRVMYLMLRWYFPEGEIMVDIGASCGVYSYLASTKHAKQIFGFEPIPELYELYLKNVPQAQCYNVALTNDPSAPHFIGKLESYHIQITSQQLAHQTPVVTGVLDDYQIQPYLMKIDVEGMGRQVLEGGLETLKHTQVVFLEVHTHEELAHCSILFKKFGFDIQILTESHILAVKPPLKLPLHYEREN